MLGGGGGGRWLPRYTTLYPNQTWKPQANDQATQGEASSLGDEYTAYKNVYLAKINGYLLKCQKFPRNPRQCAILLQVGSHDR